ncbi:MAG: hypothetical protein ACTJGT_04640 [Microbacteriaceae bacterium]
MTTHLLPQQPTLNDLAAAVRRIHDLAQISDLPSENEDQPMTPNRKALLERQGIELLAATISEIRAISDAAERGIAELLLIEKDMTLHQVAALTRYSTTALSKMRARPQYFSTQPTDES